MAATPSELAHDTAVRSLVGQRQSLDALRTRAATLLSAASIVTSFLGAQALRNHAAAHKTGFHLTVPEWAAVASFVAMALLCVAILLPWKWAGWHTNAMKLVRDYVDVPGLSLAAVQRDLALHDEIHYAANVTKMGRLYWCFRGGCALLVVQVVLWIIDLAKG